MDYLDPNKKRAKRRQLLIMYILLGIAIGIATLVVVYNVNGYSIDRKTGEVVQNGLLYIDTKPESAEVTLNGEKQRGRTDTRLVVAEGPYDVELQRTGYIPWRRTFILEGGSLRRLTYAKLIPEVIENETQATFEKTPVMATQSVDKRWVVYNFEGAPLTFSVFDTERPQAPPFSLQLPVDFLQSNVAGIWKVVDWAEDHKTFLAYYERGAEREYALINREDGTKAVNITKTFAPQVITYAEMRSRRNDELYLHTRDGAVAIARVEDKSLVNVLSSVIDVRSYGENAFIYLTSTDAPAGTVRALLRDGDKEYLLRELKQADRYLLDISKLGNAYVVGVGSPVENRVIVFNDPIHAISKNTTSPIPVPTTVLRVDNPTELHISADSSIIVAHGANETASHEFEADRSYNYKLPAPSLEGTELHWIDGQHLVYVTDTNSLRIVDFDGSNNIELATGLRFPLSFFNKNSEELYAVTTVADGSERAALFRYFLRSAEDRR